MVLIKKKRVYYFKGAPIVPYAGCLCFSFCSYASYRIPSFPSQVMNTWSMLHRGRHDALIRLGLLRPLVACAGNQSCICPRGGDGYCKPSQVHTRVGLCHRSDQSAFALVLAKLLQDKFDALFSRNSVKIQRGVRSNYFDKLARRN